MFMCVGEMGGNRPIHGRRGMANGDIKRHACGCPMFKGEEQLSYTAVTEALKQLEKKA